jgi:hypothetical protein
MAGRLKPSGQLVTNPPGGWLAWGTFFEDLWRLLNGLSPVRLQSYLVADLPSASPAGRMVYVSNASGGAVPAFSDGAAWRRVTDRTVVS